MFAIRSNRRHRTQTKAVSRRSSTRSELRGTDISTGVKSLPTMPLLKRVSPRIHELAFGEERLHASHADMNRENLRMRFVGELTQRAQFETILDVNPAHRFDLHTEPGYRTRRYDLDPEALLVTQTKPEVTAGAASSVLSVYAKSRVTAQGHLEPVAALSSDIWEESAPLRLADLVYAHVYGTNKPKATAKLATDMTPEQRAALESELREAVNAKLNAGSPLTSTTRHSLIDDFLQSWGAPGKHVSIDADRVNIVSPSYLAALILFVASDKKADAKVDFDWRTKFAEMNGQDEQKMAGILEAHGIDPDGPWTRREHCAFYALVAAEYMVIGVTPEGSARQVEDPAT